MKLEDIMQKYDVDDKAISIITNCMLEGMGLAEAELALGGSMSQVRIFAVAKFVCEFDYLIPIDEMSPRFATDRKDITEENRVYIEEKIKKAKEQKRLESILEDMRLLEIELKAKMVA